jgi:hypothetical protein
MAGDFPTALEGQIVHSIDFVPAVTAVRMDARRNVPLDARFGFEGQIGIAEGQGPILITLTFAGLSGKSQFEFLARQQQQRKKQSGFVWDFWEGSVGLSSHWVVPGCKIGDWSLTNDPKSGITDNTVSFMGYEPKQLR